MEAKTALRRSLLAVDPVALIGEIRAAQEDLGRRVDRRGVNNSVSDAEVALADTRDLDALELHGEQRATHRRPYHRRKPVPRRPRTLDAYESQVREWLKVEPGITAVDALKRLQDVAPSGAFTEKHLRTVQRAPEAWRAEAIRQWIDQRRWQPEDLNSARAQLGEGGCVGPCSQVSGIPVTELNGPRGPGYGHVDDAPSAHRARPWTTLRVAHRRSLRPHAHSLQPRDEQD